MLTSHPTVGQHSPSITRTSLPSKSTENGAPYASSTSTTTKTTRRIQRHSTATYSQRNPINEQQMHPNPTTYGSATSTVTPPCGTKAATRNFSHDPRSAEDSTSSTSPGPEIGRA